MKWKLIVWKRNSFLYIAHKVKDFFFGTLLTVLFCACELSFHVFWLLMTHNVLCIWRLLNFCHVCFIRLSSFVCCVFLSQKDNNVVCVHSKYCSLSSHTHKREDSNIQKNRRRKTKIIQNSIARENECWSLHWWIFFRTCLCELGFYTKVLL